VIACTNKECGLRGRWKRGNRAGKTVGFGVFINKSSGCIPACMRGHGISRQPASMCRRLPYEATNKMAKEGDR